MGQQTPLQAPAIQTLEGLSGSGYESRTVKQEMRENVLRMLASGTPIFPEFVGYDAQVVPEVVRAILSRHDMLLLGLRGQGKTRLLRSMVRLLDAWIPVIDHETVPLRDCPVKPATRAGRALVGQLGAQTPVRWVHRSERYIEKLATPDVTIADLIGEIDLVQHAQGRGLDDDLSLQFGLIPRANRGIFVMNELPDLAPRIQVGLFNVLEERDVQIRGQVFRLDLDMCLMFSANPEDYTNRGRIVTPLKDRIGSVVRTHYPRTIDDAMQITAKNAFVDRAAATQSEPVDSTDSDIHGRELPAPVRIELPAILKRIVEETIRLARSSAHINQASGVSVRASICAIENVVSAAEQRGVRAGMEQTTVRIADLAGVASAMRGKLELLLADEGGEGRSTEDRLIEALTGEAVKLVVGEVLSLTEVALIADAFEGGFRVHFDNEATDGDVVASMQLVDGLPEAAAALAHALEMPGGDASLACAGELVLEYLYVNNRISKIASGYAR